MKILVDIPDRKAFKFIELLNNISFVKIKILTQSNVLFLEEIKEAVDEIKQIREGKKKARNAEDFLKEL